MKLLFVALLSSGLAHSGTPDQTEKQKSAAAIKFILGDKAPRFVKEEKKEQEIAILRKPDSVYCCPVELGQCNPPFGPCPPPTPPPCHWYDNLWICDGGN